MDTAPLLSGDDEKHNAVHRFSESDAKQRDWGASRQDSDSFASNASTTSDLEHGRQSPHQPGTPDVKRRVVAEYRGQGAGFMTPRSRFRSKTKNCCGIDLVRRLAG